MHLDHHTMLPYLYHYIKGRCSAHLALLSTIITMTLLFNIGNIKRGRNTPKRHSICGYEDYVI